MRNLIVEYNIGNGNEAIDFETEYDAKNFKQFVIEHGGEAKLR